MTVLDFTGKKLALWFIVREFVDGSPLALWFIVREFVDGPPLAPWFIVREFVDGPMHLLASCVLHPLNVIHVISVPFFFASVFY